MRANPCVCGPSFHFKFHFCAMSQSPHCNSTRDGFHNSHMLQSEQHVALSKYVYAYVCIKWMHPSPLCILFMHKLPGSGGSEVVIYRVLHSKEGEAHLCLHVWVCASNLCFDAWPACKAVQRGNISEVSVCDFMFFCEYIAWFEG